MLLLMETCLKNDFKEKHIQSRLVKLSSCIARGGPRVEVISALHVYGQCSAERQHLLWEGCSGKDAGRSTISPGHCPGGEFTPRGKITRRHKKTFLLFRREALRLLPFPPLPPATVHFITASRWRWNMPGSAHIEHSISVISSNIIIFLHTRGLNSIIVCGATQIEGKDRVNKEMSMIIKAEINNTHYTSASLSIYLSLHRCLFFFLVHFIHFSALLALMVSLTLTGKL